jgi:hypothetical protein
MNEKAMTKETAQAGQIVPMPRTQRVLEIRVNQALHLANAMLSSIHNGMNKDGLTVAEMAAHPAGVLVRYSGRDNRAREAVVPYSNLNIIYLETETDRMEREAADKPKSKAPVSQ